MTKRFHPDQPIILGLAGQALTGKTVTAQALAPAARAAIQKEDRIYWDHLYFALPLYRMAAARQKIQGELQEDRIRYELHDALLDLFGRPLNGAPSYSRLVEMVIQIAETECSPDGEKPRSFLQQTGSLCRDHDPACFVKWIDRKIIEHFVQYESETPVGILDDDEKLLDTPKLPFGVVLSDVRFYNEAELIHNHPNGVLVKLTASAETRNERSLNRDGRALTTEQLSHVSEQQINTIPGEWFDAVLDTSQMDHKEQTTKVEQIVTQVLGV